MYLKKLEILGFKSFADRSEFVFQPGMTAIVGPNGCGKSNIVDAFKWIFGEQSAKGMRGSEMKDVIFNGTQERKPTGFAEVTIVFENSDRFLDIDYSEVALTRRLFRSGESEYLINKQKCRLKDIRELFMGTGIGQTSYSILEQGKIDALLQSNQVDRRFIFEEAAGISKYLAKKAETLRALLRVEDNLTRLNDIVQEVEKRLQRVKAQASKARRYRELSDRLKDLRLRCAADDFRASVAARCDIAFRLHWSNFRLNRLDRLAAQVSALLDTKAAERSAGAERMRELHAKLSAERMLLERTCERIEQERRRLVELGEGRLRKEEELVATGAALAQLQERLELERQELAGLDAEIEAKRREADRLFLGQNEARAVREGLEEALKGAKDAVVAILQRRARLGNTVVQFESEIGNLKARAERLLGAVSGYRAQEEEEKARASAARAQIERFDAERRSVEAERLEIEAAAQDLEAAIGELEERLTLNLSLVNQRRSRREVLQSLEEKLEGVGRGIADILRRRQEDGDAVPLREVHGMVASLVRVQSGSARAVEAALGVQAQSLVVETQEGALALLEFSRREELGAVEVISLDRVDVVPPEHFPRQAGVLGALRDQVEVPEAFRELFDRLLANVVLVEDFDTALALSRNGLRPFRLVTLSGEVIEPWGGLSIAGESELGLISRQSELEDLRAEVGRLEAEGALLRAQQADLKRDLGARREELELRRERASSLERSRVQAEGSLAQIARESDRLAREIAVSSSEAEEIEAQAAVRLQEKAVVDAQVGEAEAEKASVEERIERLEGEIARAAAAEASASEAVTSARLALAQTEKRQEGLREMVDRQESNLAERRTHQQSLREEIQALARRLEESEASIRSSEGELEEFRRRIEGLSTSLEGEQAKDRELVEFEQAVRRELENLHAEHARAQREREAAQLRDQEERHRRNSLVERMQEEYGIDLTQAVDEADGGEGRVQGEAQAGGQEPAWDRDQAREEIRELQEKLRRLGGVNLEALDELQELEERHRFQLAQKEDLLQSEKTLRGIIAEINKTSREMFLKTFEEIQGHFSNLFRKCFGGGKAELVLEEGADILEAGIDIVARPPGKKISSLSLMSGGEKTMTTIALLFAIFKTKPSPFCILDEVDAPLDETNVGRFVVLLEDFLAQSQFLVVTHNKVTMGQASTLYGITMQEHGVSSRVSVELESYDPAALAPVGGPANN